MRSSEFRAHNELMKVSVHANQTVTREHEQFCRLPGKSGDWAIRIHLHPEHHLVDRIGWLRAAVLGANDGILS